MINTIRGKDFHLHRSMAGERSNSHSKRWKEPRMCQNQAITMIIFLSIFSVILIALIFNMARDMLYGTWALDNVTVYAFDGKGHGGLILPQRTYEFDYSIDQTSLSIYFHDPEINDANYVYQVETNTLLLTNDEGSKYCFIKQRRGYT